MRSDPIKVAGGMALTIIRKETAMIERVMTMSFGLAHVCQAKPSDHSLDLQRIGRGSEKRYLVVIAD
jgi:hypothetical protein